MAKILIVEDEPLVAMLVEAWIVDLGHEPIGPACSLSEARNFVNLPFDAAVVDLKLGRCSGVQIAEALASKGVPFVYATGLRAEQLDNLPLSAGVLLKPFSFETFEAAIIGMLP